MKGTEQSKQKIITCIFLNIVGHSYKTKRFFFNAIDLSQMFLLWMLWITNMNKYLQILWHINWLFLANFCKKTNMEHLFYHLWEMSVSRTANNLFYCNICQVGLELQKILHIHWGRETEEKSVNFRELL